MLNTFSSYIRTSTKTAPLAVFRFFFGLMMFMSIVRFWSYGWIDKLYIKPNYFFSYYGFEWVKPFGELTYILFILCGISAIMVAIGYKYRLSILLFFLSFTYIELMDKTTYLNHYYFISLVSFVLIFLPANHYFSIDAYFNPKIRNEFVPRWNIDILKVMLGIVYFYAGLAKLNSDWLFSAMPLRIWLPGKYDLPILGELLQNSTVIYAFSWAGAIYDLAIPFLLWNRKTRLVAFLFVVFFHVVTGMLFPIGMFPYIMIVSTLIFFDAKHHERFLNWIMERILKIKNIFRNAQKLVPDYNLATEKIKLGFLIVFIFVQILLPFRYLLYPGELFWTEQGYRFSWRVMLMEKAGYANFKIQTGDGLTFYVDNTDFLTSFQEKQMSTQPDFIIEYAHMLKDHFESEGHSDVEVYVESFVAMNGRKSRPYIDPSVDLAKEKISLKPKNWILPFDDTIKGF